VLVILASSLQRLLLYEEAYGFTRARTYTHIFIFWLAALLLAAAVLEVLRRQRWFALCLLVMMFGFGITLTVVNVDGFVLNQNLARLSTGSSLDVAYLGSLSNDVVPEMIRAYHSPTAPDSSTLHDQLGSELACRLYELQNAPQRPWQSFHIGNALAASQLGSITSELEEYQVSTNNGMVKVTKNGISQTCGYLSGD